MVSGGADRLRSPGWNVARGDRSVMRRDDRLTDRKANAHATAAVGIVSRCRAGAIEDDRQLFFRNSGPVITDVKGYRGVIVRDIAVDRLAVLFACTTAFSAGCG